MIKAKLRTFTYWTALPAVGVLLAACGDDGTPGMPTDPLETDGTGGQTDTATSEAPNAGQSSAEPGPGNETSAEPAGSTTVRGETTEVEGNPSDPTPTSSSSEPEPAPPLDSDVFPVGLAVQSLLSREAPVNAEAAFLKWKDPNGVEVSAEEQIAKALQAADASECAVVLPPLTTLNSPSCYGPAVNFANHPDGECSPPSQNETHCKLPSGDLGIWHEVEGDTAEACTAAKFNADVNSVGLRVDAALVMAASAVCAWTRDGGTLPAAGESVDVAAVLQAALSVHQQGIAVDSATITNVAAEGGAMALTYTVSVEHNGQTISYTLEHSPGESGYKGKLWGEVSQPQDQPPPNPPLQALLALDGGVSSGFMDGGMPPPPDFFDGGMPPPPEFADGGMPPPPPCEGNNCPPPPCEGGNCPAPSPGGDAEVFSVSYELTSDQRLRTRMLTKNGAVGGAEAFTADGQLAPSGAWSRSMSLTVLDVDQVTGTGKGAYLWQAGPFDDRTRVFNVYTEPTDDGSKSGCGFFGYGSPFGETMPELGIENFICNWAGPSNNHQGLSHFAQKQCMAPNSYGIWEPSVSYIAYAPSNTCESTDTAFAGGESDDTNDWTPFAQSSNLVDLASDTDYTDGFGTGPSAPSL